MTNPNTKTPDRYQPDADRVALLRTPLLHERAIRKAEQTVSISHPDVRDKQQAALDVLRRRWDAETPARALRDELRGRGFRQSDYEYRGLPAWQVWIRKNTSGSWVKYTPEEAIVAIDMPRDSYWTTDS